MMGKKDLVERTMVLMHLWNGRCLEHLQKISASVKLKSFLAISNF